MDQVKNDNTVKVHYKGTLNNGTVFDSSENREPLEFTVGAGQMIPGFEKAVMDMKKDETKKVTIPSVEAYGPVNDQLFNEVDRAHLPGDLKPEVGMQLVSKQPDGREMVVKITDVKDASVTIDANHPLAGEDLTFEITLVEIK
ncbi:MAG: peptidylprolyl isomerase [Bacteroidia bacterium]|nr:peptidylprolyl isomerase [Bacteroidia bacterium]NNM15949.1 peptidylprolyl isomerase [Bacteroidia bacterium]